MRYGHGRKQSAVVVALKPSLPFGCSCIDGLAVSPTTRCLDPNISSISISGTCRVQHVMSFLQHAGRLFSVETLDTRFTTSSKTPPSRIDPTRPSPVGTSVKNSGQGRNGARDIALGASPPRWKSPEFIYHGLVFLVVVPLMFKTVYEVSKRKHALRLCGTPFLIRSLMFNE